MRLVIDTNVFVSALIRPGDTMNTLLDYIDLHATVLYSEETLTELIDVLRRQKFSRYTSVEEVADFVKWIAEAGEFVVVQDHVTRSRDPKDDKFLSLAVTGKANYIITGDKDLLELEYIGSASIVSPAKFMGMVSH